MELCRWLRQHADRQKYPTVRLLRKEVSMSIVDPPMVNKLMLVPEGNTFIGAQPGSALVIHKTASGGTAEDVANFFIHDPNGASSHFVIGQDGEIVKCVHLINVSRA